MNNKNSKRKKNNPHYEDMIITPVEWIVCGMVIMMIIAGLGA